MSDKLEFNRDGMKDLEEQVEAYVQTLGRAVRDEAKTLCNVDTSLLKNSIEVYDSDKKNTKLIGVEDDVVPYALTQEIGNSKLNTIPSFKPHLRPALQTIISKVGGTIL